MKACTLDCGAIMHMTGGRHRTDCPAYAPGCSTCGSHDPDVHPISSRGVLHCGDAFHKRPRTSITERLRLAFGRFEQLGPRVGDIWLNPEQIRELDRDGEPAWERIAQASVIRTHRETKGVFYRGVFLNVRVFESSIVPVNCIAIAPEGLDATLTGPAACTPF